VSLFVASPEIEDRDAVEVDNWASKILKNSVFSREIIKFMVSSPLQLNFYGISWIHLSKTMQKDPLKAFSSWGQSPLGCALDWFFSIARWNESVFHRVL
jgi:hypothetical protein